MTAKNRLAYAVLAALSLATTHAMGAEPTEDMRALAAMLAALDAQDQNAYCKTMQAEPYAGYLGRVCQSAVQNKLKKAEDCSSEHIAQQAKSDNQQCKKMTRADFDKIALRSREAVKTFIEQARAQGVDGEKLLQSERAKLR